MGIHTVKCVYLQPTLKRSSGVEKSVLGLGRSLILQKIVLHKDIFIILFKPIYTFFPRKIDMIIYDYHSLAYTQSMDRECDIKILQLQNAQVGIGLSFSKKSTWKRRFNLAVISMVNSGQSDTIASQWFKLQHCVKTNNFYSLDIRRMASLFIWLSIGILGCVMIFAIVFFIRCLRRLCIKKDDQ